jgi:Xaa-Pro aminopeptidase
VTATVATRPTIPAGRYTDRLAAARVLADKAGLSAILIGVGPDMRHLCGYGAHPSERLTMLVVPANGAPTLVAPRLEAAPARLAPPTAAGLLPIETWDEGGDAYALVASLVRASMSRQSSATLGVAVSDDLPARHLLQLEDRLGGPSVSHASDILREIRIIKDADEIALLRLAAEAADRVVEQIASGRLVVRP